MTGALGAEASEPSQDPFPGPRPLQADDRLFGRDDELLQLHDLLVAHRIVLLYSPSGAGKSSLLEAGLRPKLEDEGFRVVGPLRVGQAAGAGGSAEANPYLASMAADLATRAPPGDGTDGVAGFRGRVEALEKEGEGKPLVLVFDQFEELLTTTVDDDLAHADQVRAEFLQELGEVLRDKSRWAVFAMREDYIAALDPFLHLVPTQLSTRFRIDLLRHDQALEAVKGPVSELRPFQDEAAEALVTILRMVRMPQRGGGFASLPGRFVEPLHLQLVCRRLWIDTAGRAEIGVEDVRKGSAGPSGVGDGRTGTRDPSSVERALSDYYGEQVRAISKEHRVDEGRTRDWFDRQLIVGDHRSRTLEGPFGAAPPEDPLLRRIVDSHLVRTSKSGDAVWYELAHDRLIEPVSRNDRDWRWEHGGRTRRLAAVTGSAVVGVVLILLAGVAVISFRNAEQAEVERRNFAQLAQLFLNPRAVVEATTNGLQGHTGSVNAVAFSPDGTIIASGGADGRVMLWDVATRRPQGEPLEGHTGPVYALAVDADGGTFASGGADGTVILWDVTSLERTGESLEAHVGPVYALAVDPEGTIIASGGADRMVVLWDVATRQPLGEPLKGHEGAVYALAADADRGTVVSGSADGSVILWDVTSLEPTGESLEGHVGPVYALAVDPGGTTIASGGADGTVILWDMTTRQPRGEPLKGHRGPVYALAVDPGGTTIASGGADGTVILWDMTTRQPRGEPLTGHTGPVRSVAFDPDGTTLASGSADGTVIIWDVDEDS